MKEKKRGEEDDGRQFGNRQTKRQTRHLQKGFREERANGMGGRMDGRTKPPRDRVEHERGNGTLWSVV
jgi:hypothetical protein